MIQEKHKSTIDLGSGVSRDFFYFREEILTMSPNLGREIGIAHQSGLRRTLGILTPKEVVWSSDPNLPRHLYLAQAVNTENMSQFQNIKLPGEYQPRICISGHAKLDIIKLTQHILHSQPHFALNITLDLLNEQEVSSQIYRGTVGELKRVIEKI